jgi:hypothetical protein
MWTRNGRLPNGRPTTLVVSCYLIRMDDSMNVAEIVKQLKSERESLTKAIEALEGIEAAVKVSQGTELSQLQKPRLPNSQVMDSPQRVGSASHS